MVFFLKSYFEKHSGTFLIGASRNKPQTILKASIMFPYFVCLFFLTCLTHFYTNVLELCAHFMKGDP